MMHSSFSNVLQETRSTNCSMNSLGPTREATRVHCILSCIKLLANVVE